MHFNSAVRSARPLGNLRKPGAGVYVPMTVAPPGVLPLLLENITRAENAALMVLGGPDFAVNPGMIHEHNLLAIAPDLVAGVYDPALNFARRTELLANIVDLVNLAWVDLTNFLIDAQNMVLAKVRDLMDARTPEDLDAASWIVMHYADQLTALGPQINDLAIALGLAGQLVPDKVRALKVDFTRARTSLLSTLTDAAKAIAASAGAAADALTDAAKALAKAQKQLTYAIAGIAVVALVGAAIYFIPRPRRR